ncbi:hypothetical protein [Serratia quinivorans]|uniref:hypothetical protein n=1 Tax=Serratia quinivorans TaxID=137545 RepID=UPI0029EEEDDC|nr:hypothetical protein [Serratia liquefaciens]
MKTLSIGMSVLGIAAVIGWIMNVWKIIDTGFVLAEWGGLQVARVIGVFVAPLGAVLGWF